MRKMRREEFSGENLKGSFYVNLDLKNKNWIELGS